MADNRRAADYRIDHIETCFKDIEEAEEATILHICYTVNAIVEPTNVLIVYVTGTPHQRLEAVQQFRDLAKSQRLTEDEGLHHCGYSYIVISNSIHWGDKYREFLAFELS